MSTGNMRNMAGMSGTGVVGVNVANQTGMNGIDQNTNAMAMGGMIGEPTPLAYSPTCN